MVGDQGVWLYISMLAVKKTDLQNSGKKRANFLGTGRLKGKKGQKAFQTQNCNYLVTFIPIKKST